MGARVDFYHLTRDPAPTVLARLAERVLAGEARLLVVADGREDREAIDAALWTVVPESFLPHAMTASAIGDEQNEPILIGASIGGPAPNGATMAALADGVWRDEALAFERTLFLFDSQRIDDARSAWRTLSKQDGIECHYWKQDGNGRWREGP
jgi:DNA polymerase III subunit chi